MDWAAFAEQVGVERDCGEVIVLGAPEGEWSWLSSGQPHAGTFPLHREAAGHLLTGLLTHDLAYRTPLLPTARAAELARTYLDAVHPAARLYTNAVPPEPAVGQSAGWTPLTQATFDRGVYSLHPAQQTVFWVLDED